MYKEHRVTLTVREELRFKKLLLFRNPLKRQSGTDPVNDKNWRKITFFELSCVSDLDLAEVGDK